MFVQPSARPNCGQQRLGFSSATANNPLHPGDHAGTKLLRHLWSQLGIPRSFAKPELSKPRWRPINAPEEENQPSKTQNRTWWFRETVLQARNTGRGAGKPESSPYVRSNALPSVRLQIFTPIFRPLDCKDARDAAGASACCRGRSSLPGLLEMVSPGQALGTSSKCSCRNETRSAPIWELAGSTQHSSSCDCTNHSVKGRGRRAEGRKQRVQHQLQVVGEGKNPINYLFWL